MSKANILMGILCTLGGVMLANAAIEVTCEVATEISSQLKEATKPVIKVFPDMDNINPLPENVVIEGIGNTTNKNETSKPNKDKEIVSTENVDVDYEYIEPVKYTIEHFLVEGSKTAITFENLNVRKEPSTDSEIIDTLPAYTTLEVYDYNNTWGIIEYKKNTYGYICKVYLDNTPFEEKPIISDTRKSYMDFRAITDETSRQYKLQLSCHTDTNGLRKFGERYCVALGSFYTHNIGTYVDIILENGIVIPAILGDAKDDMDTTWDNSTGLDGGAVEFIVDTNKLSEDVSLMGSVSFISDEWYSNAKSIRIYNKNIFLD